MKCKLLLLSIVVLAVLGGSIATHTAQAKSATVAFACPGVVKHIYSERNATRALERKMGHTQSRSNFNASKVRSCAYAQWVVQEWKFFHTARLSEYHHWLKQQNKSPEWLVNAFLCIHSHEGAWNDNTGNGYYGGLQFGYKEWLKYGGMYATWAYDATPAQQIQAGINYYHVSGFSPWPHTAAACGLL